MALRDAPLWHLTMARIRTWMREPEVLFWSFGFPILLTIALGVAFRNRPAEAVTVLVEAGPSAAQVAKALAEDKQLTVAIVDHGEAARQLRAGLAALSVRPEPPLTVRYDPTRPESRVAKLLTDNAIQRSLGRRDVAEIAGQVVDEPGARYVDFLVPGLIGMNLMQSGLWGVGYSIVEMRSKRLLRRLVATPMRKSDFLLSFLITRLLLLLIELPVVMGMAYLLFDVRIQGSLVAYLAVAVTGALAFAGVGLLVASRAKTTQTASGLMNLVSMPMFVGSGVFFSVKNFPEMAQPLLRLLPLTALNDGLRAVQNEASGLVGVLPQLAVLGGIGVVTLILAVRIFRWD
ncbi:MAG: ABC transporter permease [Deltaproteobacteria bacterium]|nr:ABC transporter permease [Deltaproteobacteria bacterium]